MSSNTGSKAQGKKQDTAHSKQNQSRGNKKWSGNNNNNNSNNAPSASGGGGSARGGNYQATTGNSNNTNGNNQSSPTTSPMIEDPDLIHHMHDRMLFLLGSLYGSKVQVTVRNGTKYEGLFQGATTEGDLGISLTLARKIHDPTTTDKAKSSVSLTLPSLLIFSKDLMEITALDTDLTAGEASRQEKDTFKTDTDISGKGEFKERLLHKWNPEMPEDEALKSLEDGLESSNGGGSWDQFAANEKLFGLKTDFDEELYTTHLDRSAPDYKDREKWAIEKANEIQRSTTNNPHMLEERNVTTTDDSGMDEEDRYGAVVRDLKEKENVYLPPALRSKQPAPKPQAQSGNAPSFPPDSPLYKLTTGTLANVSSSRYEPSKSKKNVNEKQAPKRIESEIANTFRQFAIQEKDKLQAKRQALHKKEQSDRLAELVKFHKSFKLDVPIPPDMLPLLAKSKKSPTSSSSGTDPSTKSSPESSPDAQQASASGTAKTSTAKTPKATDATETPAGPAKSSTESTSAKKSGFKFNIKATEFKPNPSAAAFVPGGAKTGAPADASAAASSAPTVQPLRKSGFDDPVTVDEIFKSPLGKGKSKKPNTVGPTWPYGSKQYRHQFNHYNTYSEDLYTGYPAPAYGYGYPQYRYHQQYVPGMPAIPVQQQNVSYMNHQFVPNVPITNAPMHHGGYSPQMANGSPHGSPFPPPQGYPSPQRSPMPPPNNLPPPPPPQVYQYQGNHSPSGPMPVRYAPEMMTSPSGTPVMIQHHRPVLEHKSPGTAHYPPPAMNYSPERMNSPSQTDSSEQ